MADAKLLSAPTNYAVVQLPERQFPGIVFQGDSLNGLIGELRSAVLEVDGDERNFTLQDIIERLESIQRHYESVLEREGLKLPYPKRCIS